MKAGTIIYTTAPAAYPGAVSVPYVSQDIDVSSILGIVEQITAHLEAGETLHAALYVGELSDWVESVARPAARSLALSHAARGVDLKHAPDLLRFVQSVDPTFSIVGEVEW